MSEKLKSLAEKKITREKSFGGIKPDAVIPNIDISPSYGSIAANKPFLIKVFRTSRTYVGSYHYSYLSCFRGRIEWVRFTPKLDDVIKYCISEFVYLYTHAEDGIYDTYNEMKYWGHKVKIDILSTEDFESLCKEHNFKMCPDDYFFSVYNSEHMIVTNGIMEDCDYVEFLSRMEADVVNFKCSVRSIFIKSLLTFGWYNLESILSKDSDEEDVSIIYVSKRNCYYRTYIKKTEDGLLSVKIQRDPSVMNVTLVGKAYDS